MDLIQLKAFVAVAETGGVRRAAGKVFRTQPTVSRQLAALEASLGRPLFLRAGRRMELTAFGREALDRARGILAAAESLSASGRAGDLPLSGVLRLGAADSVIFERLPRLLRSFLRRHPGVRLQVRTGSSPEILSWVRDGQCEAGLCMIPGSSPGLACRPLWEDRLVAIVPKGHRLAGLRARLADFAAERQVVIRPDTLSYQAIAGAFQRGGAALVSDTTFDTFHLLASFVEAGLGVGVCSASVARPFLARGGVRRVRIREIDALRRRLGVAHRYGEEPQGALAALIAALPAKGARLPTSSR